MDQYELDRQTTVENRAKLTQNFNLVFWYEQLYKRQFEGIADFSSKRVLEIGSGTSPIKRFHPHVLTSDILPLDYLDFVFDCHEIDQFDGVPAGGLDIITMTNVLHHLRDPLLFLQKAATKLKPGALLIATEPYVSVFSGLVWRYLHHEAIDLNVAEPRLTSVTGPLASSNQALPYLIFKKRVEWAERLTPPYDSHIELRPFTALAYLATGGISRRLPVPHALYRSCFEADYRVASMFPDALASFFTIVLRRSVEGASIRR
jgi:SAM-dependent methyltransferase